MNWEKRVTNLQKKSTYSRDVFSEEFIHKELFHPSAQRTQNSPSLKIELQQKIDIAASVLREKTIALVRMLRMHTLNHEIEGEIENYMTEVLDQMDILQAKYTSQTQSLALDDKEGLSNFQQLPKPSGDDECSHLEDTYRESLRPPLEPIQELSKEATQVDLNSKLQSILSDFEKGTYVGTKRQEQNYPEGRAKNQHKAHKFSSLYLRDVARPKKNRLF